MYNPTKEKLSLKKILEKIKAKEEINSKHIENEDMEYIKKNVENIKFYKCKNKNNYLISDLCDYSEIALIKKS